MLDFRHEQTNIKRLMIIVFHKRRLNLHCINDKASSLLLHFVS